MKRVRISGVPVAGVKKVMMNGSHTIHNNNNNQPHVKTNGSLEITPENNESQIASEHSSEHSSTPPIQSDSPPCVPQAHASSSTSMVGTISDTYKKSSTRKTSRTLHLKNEIQKSRIVLSSNKLQLTSQRLVLVDWNEVETIATQRKEEKILKWLKYQKIILLP
mmetsp:Transcript_38455/g.49756  ORF Transcript_38455/g.49756 Transcript_38455/m.49756 type:complete len:164 (+) Transcript_38455:343-834(+)